MNTTRVRIAIAVVVTAVWMASYALSIVNHHYHPPAEINAVMLLVAGFFFASGIREQSLSAFADREREELRHVIDEEIRRREAAEDGHAG